MPPVLSGGRYAAFYTVSLSPVSIGATPVLTLDAQIKTDVSVNYTAPHEITIEHIRDDSGLQSFLDSYTPLNIGSESEEITYEDGSKFGGSVEQPLLMIVRGGLSGQSRKIYTAVVQIDPTSGSWSQEGNKYNRPTLKLRSVDPGSTVTVAATYYTGVATTPAQVTLGLGAYKYGRITFA